MLFKTQIVCQAKSKYEAKCKNSIFFIFAEVDLDESNNVSLEEQVDLLDDYTPLDPAYLPAGLGEDDNKVRIFFTAIIAHNWTKWQKLAKIRF